MSPKTAYCLVIGNEILTGKVKDLNSVYFAQELSQLGTQVEGIFILPDEIETIAEFVKKYRYKCDFLLTSGGVGPTHDDVTMEGIARGLEVELKENQEIIELLKKRYGETLPAPLRRMALLPEKARLVQGENLHFPLVAVENIYIFPGDPELLKKKFESVKKLFQGVPRKLKRLFLNKDEFAYAESLTQTQATYPEVAIGSYPKYLGDSYKAMVTFESFSEEKIEKAIASFLAQIPAEWVLTLD